MTDNEIRKANNILDKFDFFSQRAGRELWSDKPKDIQDKDIENFLNDVKFLKNLINRQKAEIERLKRLLEEEEAKYKDCANVEYRKNCDNCPIKAVCDSEDYGDIKLVNDLINRQKAEIDALRKTILDADYSSITALKAKESWHMENSIYIYQLNERIDRLQADNSSMQSTLAKMSMGVEEAKAEAIKEFAENCKKGLRTGEIIMDKSIRDIIDNLVKEMVGDTE